MNAEQKINIKSLGARLISSVALGMVLLAIPGLGVAQDYQGSEVCSNCHDSQKYNDWQTSGHSTIFMEGMDAMHRSLPTPDGEEWDDISYVVGGHKTKTNYLDSMGYLMTGNTQYNLRTGEWSSYFPGEVKSYDCGACHTTGYLAGGNPPGLPGIVGTFALPAVQCERCHGPGTGFDSSHHQLDPTPAAACGDCHNHAALDTIAASGGFIKSEGQYNEFLAGPHAKDIGGEYPFSSCVNCHDPHKPPEFGMVKSCSDCHADKAASFEGTIMSNAGVECEDCHMPPATLSAQALGPHEGDLKTHIFYINTDPTANMFTPDGSAVLQIGGKAAVTLDFVCQRCHGSSSKEELSKWAKDFHTANGSLANFGLDPGLTGTWWKTTRAGEGILLEVGYAGGQLFLFASFYTYGPGGEQVWLTAQLTSVNGTTANVDVFMPQGGKWGDAFVPGDVTAVPWGSGFFMFPTCGSGSFDITPNQAMAAEGFTALAYDIIRTLVPGIACPTFQYDLQ